MQSRVVLVEKNCSSRSLILFNPRPRTRPARQLLATPLIIELAEVLHSGIWGSSLFTSGRKSTDVCAVSSKVSEWVSECVCVWLCECVWLCSIVRVCVTVCVCVLCVCDWVCDCECVTECVTVCVCVCVLCEVMLCYSIRCGGGSSSCSRWWRCWWWTSGTTAVAEQTTSGGAEGQASWSWATTRTGIHQLHSTHWVIQLQITANYYFTEFVCITFSVRAVILKRW